MNFGWKMILIAVIYISWFVIASGIVATMREISAAPLAVLQIFMVLIVYLVARARLTEPASRHISEMEKPKRVNAADPDAKMRLLLEMMDDDERYAFKQAMKERMLSGSRDGELNYDADSLGALLDEDDYPHRRKR